MNDEQRAFIDVVKELAADLAAIGERVDGLSQRVYELEQRIPDPLWAEKAEAANRAAEGVDWP